MREKLLAAACVLLCAACAGAPRASRPARAAGPELGPVPFSLASTSQAHLGVALLEPREGESIRLQTLCGPRAVLTGKTVAAATKTILESAFDKVVSTGTGFFPPGTDIRAGAELREDRFHAWFHDRLTNEPVWTFDLAFDEFAGRPCAPKDLARYYEGQLQRALDAFPKALRDRQEWLAAYPSRAAQAPETAASAERALAKGDKARALTLYIEALDGLPYGTKLFQSLVDKTLPLLSQGEPPPVPDEARRAMTQGQTRFKAAKTLPELVGAVDDLKRAVELAPWWASAWFNLAIAYEASSTLHQVPSGAPKAVECYKRYLAAAPSARDAGEIRKRVWALETKTP